VSDRTSFSGCVISLRCSVMWHATFFNHVSSCVFVTKARSQNEANSVEAVFIWDGNSQIFRLQSCFALTYSNFVCQTCSANYPSLQYPQWLVSRILTMLKSQPPPPTVKDIHRSNLRPEMPYNWDLPVRFLIPQTQLSQSQTGCRPVDPWVRSAIRILRLRA